ncbi:FAD/NAD(P)-binding domain-containing protein [Rhizodiscina lignyota]|uniref:FAD/NAD(P)-binding domain-containing protein n=1 Tax=Rhizodiscina lignyota TaxID=1504668 RepID=A0A9P4I8T8_9PEZI|nr:FAD/NAD(P)-binding domain-containing protein [Rhizodiscina lignyota]
MYLDSSKATDQKTDIVVVGTGPGGLSAVAGAVYSGAQVVSIEAQPRIGGNSVWSTGWVAFVDTAMQRAEGLQDSEEIFLADCEKLIEKHSPQYPISWDVELGKRPLQASVNRLHAVEDTEMFPQAFEQDFAGPNVKTYVNTTAQELIIEGRAVKGVVVKANNGTISAFRIHARKGVILATGGYQANPALRSRYQLRTESSSPAICLDTCRGDGQLMGQTAGGDLINMCVIPPVVIVASAMVQEAIAVNAQGVRFHNEAGPYYDRVELAGIIDVPAKALANSVRSWNDFLASSETKDPQTGRVAFSEERKRIDKAPIYAARMVTGVGLTCGGFATTRSMQVVNALGRPIEGLFAVGDTAGGFTPTESMGGTHLGGGFVLGWVQNSRR